MEWKSTLSGKLRVSRITCLEKKIGKVRHLTEDGKSGAASKRGYRANESIFG